MTSSTAVGIFTLPDAAPDDKDNRWTVNDESSERQRTAPAVRSVQRESP